MSTNKAPGIDKVPIRVIKDSLPAILPSITSIINASFKLSTFPSCWKIAEVTPILKDGDREIPSNNRPISLLPVLSKVCERAAHDQLVFYLSTKQRLSTQQCGNKKWNSTETALIQTTDSILQNIDKKELTAAVLLDMSKAFDSIDHDILITKLRDVGLSCSTIEWFKSYLSSRYQVVGQINRVKHVLDKDTLTIVVNCLVFSKLFYCSNVWSNTTESNLDKVQKVQNFACRIVSGVKKFDHITPVLRAMQWLPIRQQLY